MALQRISSLGVVSSVSLGMLLGCTGLLGIEEATCDVTYDPSCASAIESLVPAAGSGGAAPVAGAAGAAGVAGAPAAAPGGAAGVAATAGSSGSGGAPAEVAGPSLCDRYCETIATACTEENEQYASPMACQAVCSRLEPGTPGNFTGNTVECRLARAELGGATGEPQNYCPSAGPGGADVCGSDCEGFCAIMVATCDDLMGSYEECVSECTDNVPNLAGPPDNLAYDTSLQDGNSVQCRLFHVTAATLDPRTHCAHAAGLAVCAPPAVPVPDLP